MIDEIAALTKREIKKWMKNPFLLFMMIVQPVMWLGLFGKAFNLTGLVNIDTSNLPPYITQQISQMIDETFSSLFGTTDYFTYMAAGMLCIIVLFTSMFSGMSIVWDRRFGFLNKLLVAPIKRGSIVLAKVFSSVLRALFQALLIFGIALAFGLQLGNAFGILDLLGILSVLFLLSLGLSSLFIALTIRIKSHETVIALANLLNLPLMFASNALFPIKQMPDWLQSLASWNPISYSTDAIRKFILHSEAGLDFAQLARDFQFLIVFAFVFTTLGLVLAERALRKR
ncbi:MAG: ABC transporter permease [Candidatus Bathyarchaeia archaeon]